MADRKTLLSAMDIYKKCGIEISDTLVPGGVRDYGEYVQSKANDTSSHISMDIPKRDQALSEAYLKQPVTAVKTVGPALAQHLNKLNIFSIGDLIHHFPHKYLDLSRVKRISDLRTGENVTVVGEVKQVKKWRGKKGMQVINVSLSDGSGYITGVWFNQAFIANRLKEGMQVSFSGKVDYKMRQLQISNPLYDVLTEGGNEKNDTVNSGRIVPIHPATQNLTTNTIRRIIKNALDDLKGFSDPLPSHVCAKQGLISKSLAIREIHFPSSRAMLLQARARLIFEELFLMQVGLAARKRRLEITLKGIEHKTGGELIRRFYEMIPFKLTGDQQAVIAEIETDMVRPIPMNRLLQGEVGSGKTMVALATLLTSVQSGYQAAMMAPTEVLASQHHKKLSKMLDALGVNSALLTGTRSPKERERLLQEIKSGDIDIVIGTHAIIQESVDFARLGVIVIDEQHRFGVEQRLTLKEKGFSPDVLVMSATPIPRTLSLTLYGDLDVSIIKELPSGKKIADHIDTKLYGADERDSAYDLIRSEISAGRQAYIVCPLIEESDKMEVKAVLEEADRLKNEIFPELRVGLIHGKLKSDEKEFVMNSFGAGDFDILISTTVIEVGIDVPNATVMLIEDADRFGLAQLHQLRGRVGRGGFKSYCVLFASLTTDDSRQRMDAICNIKDGFLLAEADLKIRGEGQLFGTRQSGLPDLKLAKLIRDMDILIAARKDAFSIVEKDPYLASPENVPLLGEVIKKFGDSLDWLFQS